MAEFAYFFNTKTSLFSNIIVGPFLTFTLYKLPSHTALKIVPFLNVSVLM
jgi:hypothetical protein